MRGKEVGNNISKLGIVMIGFGKWLGFCFKYDG